MHHETAETAHLLRLLFRGAPIIVFCTLVVMAAAILVSRQQEPRFEASTDVFLELRQIGSSVAELGQLGGDPERALATQAAVATIPAVLDRAVKRLPGAGVNGTALLDASTVAGGTKADILVFTVTSDRPEMATRLANAYASGYVDYRREVDTRTLRRALAEVDDQLADLRGSGQPDVSFLQLEDRRQQLRQRELLRASAARVGRPATTATKTQPKTTRNAILGGVLGMLLGIGIALLRSTMSTRIRSAPEVESLVGLRLLGRVTEPDRRLRRESRLAMLEEPASVDAEAYRMLSTNIELANLDRGAKTIMVTSATAGEGKSTTLANVAVSFARFGRRVVLIDLDLRRPTLHNFFDVPNDSGLVDVTLDRLPLVDALVNIPIGGGDAQSNGRSLGDGGLLLLPAGHTLNDPSEFVRSGALSSVLRQLARGADLVLIDTPPLLHVSDGMTLTSKVDAVIIAVRLSKMRRHTLRELRRLLDAAPVAKLGFFTTSADDSGDPSRYAYDDAVGGPAQTAAGTQ